MTLTHFKRVMHKSFRAFLWFIVGFVSLTLVLSAVIFFTLLIAEHNGKLDKWIKESTGWSMQYHAMHIGIHSWNPSIVLQDVILTDPANPNTQFALKQFEVDLAVWPTLVKREPVTSELIISGLTLNVKELPKEEWQINNMVMGGETGSSDLLQAALTWLLDQKKITINDLSLNLTLENGRNYALDPVNIVWRGTDRKMRMNAGLLNIPGSKFVFNADFFPAKDLTDFKAWQLRFDGSMKADDFSPLLVGHSIYQLKFLSGGGEVDFNGLVENGDINQLQMGVSLNNLNLSHTRSQSINLTQIDEQIFWQSFGKDQGWSLRIQPVSGAASALGVAGSGLVIITYHPNDPIHTWAVSADQVDLKILGEWIDFWFTPDEQIAKIWAPLDPHGTVESLEIMGSSQSGSISFAGKELGIAANNMFPQGWPASDLTFHGSWQQNEKQKNWLVNVDNFDFSNDHLTVNAKGTTTISAADPENPYLDITANLQGKNLDEVRNFYIPQNFKNLAHWLNQGLVKLPEVTANLTWKGKLHDMPYADKVHPGIFHLEIDVPGASIEPWLNWPLIENMNAKLVFNNQRFTIDAPTASTQGVMLNQLHFELKDMRPATLTPIFITGSANPTGAQALNYIASMPVVSPRVQSVLKSDFQLSGSVPVNLNIEIPLHESNLPPVIASGSATFKGNNLNRLQGKQNVLWFKNMLGVVNFENQYLSSNSFNFVLQTYPCNIQIVKSPVTDLHVLIPKASLYGQTFTNVNAFIQEAPSNTVGTIKNPLITFVLNDNDAAGTVIVHPAGNIEANLDKWIVTPTAATSSSPAKNTKVTKASANSTGTLPSDYLKHLGVVLSQIPPLNLTAKQFSYGADNLGSLKIQSNPMPDGVEIQQLTVGGDNAELDVAGSIVTHNQQDEISLAGNLQGNNFGDALTQLGYPGIMDSGSGNIKFEFNWFGSLLHPDWTTFQGNANFNVASGKFLKVDTGIAQIFGLLSLNTVVSTFSLDFKGIFAGGLSFSSIKGDYTIHDGIAHTDNFAISGPTVDVKVKGAIDLVNQTINQTLVIKPQIGTSAALAATVIGGPIAGAATFVANALLTNTVLKNTGFVYQITGPLSKPKAASVPVAEQNSQELQ